MVVELGATAAVLCKCPGMGAHPGYSEGSQDTRLLVAAVISTQDWQSFL